eukprot:6684350-Alexandrium_andersonii.AAC.1
MCIRDRVFADTLVRLEGPDIHADRGARRGFLSRGASLLQPQPALRGRASAKRRTGAPACRQRARR